REGSITGHGMNMRTQCPPSEAARAVWPISGPGRATPASTAPAPAGSDTATHAASSSVAGRARIVRRRRAFLAGARGEDPALGGACIAEGRSVAAVLGMRTRERLQRIDYGPKSDAAPPFLMSRDPSPHTTTPLPEAWRPGPPRPRLPTGELHLWL